MAVSINVALLSITWAGAHMPTASLSMAVSVNWGVFKGSSTKRNVGGGRRKKPDPDQGSLHRFLRTP